ncbi:flagellar biosynthesis protein FlhG [Pullulanibacillus pueri]|uniref:Flagellum site-determining protein YlxH n=1 Tax=Pullulanibacillus pueri TaxID=1437324 RepID=A0A8J3EMC7_9BACL|nr:MinD/ParA family protein [Pullulanibacillus pueri]MBM7682496.1 flagellar biosynthesis protein FlhG [Pullulanibacillus pueri]GGH82166.1 flagellum site-determining protein YlxH [Pullulanibacillus pueri]
MKDQAEALRRRVERLKINHTAQTRHTKVIAVLSGKGGVGKSVFSLNFALGLHQSGKKTLIIDLDIGMGNIDILLGLHCQHNIVDMIDNQLKIETVITYHESGLGVLTGGSGLSDLFKLNETKFAYFLDQLRELKRHFDFIIFDLGAGMNHDTLQFVKAVHEILLVTTTEPTALTDAYAVVKITHRYANEIPIRCIINRYDSEREVKETWAKLSGVSERFLGKNIHFLGALPRDTAVIKAVKRQKPFLIEEPRSKISSKLKGLIATYLQDEAVHPETSLDSFIFKLKHLFR